MIFREIEPKLIKHLGETVWIVRTPKDLVHGANFSRFKYFRDEKEAWQYVARLSAARHSLFGAFMRLSQPEQAAILRCLESVGADGLIKAVEMFADLQRLNKPLIEVIQECVLSRRTAGLKPRYLKNFSLVLDSFRRNMPTQAIGQITAADIEKWLNGNGWSAWSRRTYRKDVTALFEFARKRGYVNTNPAEPILYPRVEDGPPRFLTVPQVARLLQTTQATDAGLVSYFALILFAGLRPEEAQHAKQMPGGKILVEARHAKLRARRIVEPTQTCRSWLAVAPVKPLKRLGDRRRAIAKAAGLWPWPKNCLRHSFCSYHFAMWEDAAKTAFLAGHEQETLFANYRELVTKEEAEKFWALRPTAPQTATAQSQG